MNDHMMNNVDQYGDGYMEPEEEWEREGLLDPAWEKQQKKVRNCEATFQPCLLLWKCYYLFCFTLNIKSFINIKSSKYFDVLLN